VDADDRTDIEPGVVVDLSTEVIGLSRVDGSAALMPSSAGGPPKRLDGHTIGFGMITSDNLPPHAGEMHPDGDEVLVMTSGCIEVDLELPDGTRTVRLGSGEALVVPRGVWHLIRCVEPGRLLNVTPGPSGEYRELPAGG
jgi:mannose-6-phosphate isomerase-like protein (cupin superfamily)